MKDVKIPMWGCYEFPTRVDVAPVGQRHVLGHGNCWCGITAERTTGRPLVVHEIREHEWVCSKPGTPCEVVCQRCGKHGDVSNLYDWCPGPADVKVCRGS